MTPTCSPTPVPVAEERVDGHDDQQHTFKVALHDAGYRTAMMGKYINGYLEGTRRAPVSNRYMPSGWNEWDVAGEDASVEPFQLPNLHRPINVNPLTLTFDRHDAQRPSKALLLRRKRVLPICVEHRGGRQSIVARAPEGASPGTRTT
jgi:hypothetical protein